MILVIKQHKTLINVLVVASLKFVLHLCFGIYVMLYALGFGFWALSQTFGSIKVLATRYEKPSVYHGNLVRFAFIYQRTRRL